MLDFANPIETIMAVPPGHSNRNLYLRNIPATVTDELLEQALRIFGVLESKKVMRDIHTGKSQEKAFARFRTHAEAHEAMRYILQSGLFGVMPRVEWAKQQFDDTLTEATRYQRKKLFMRNIPGDVTEDQIRQLAEQYGPVESVNVLEDTQVSMGSTPPVPTSQMGGLRIAFVMYANEGCAATACDKLYQTYPFPSCGSTPIMTKLAETKKERAPRRDPPRNGHRRLNGMGPHNRPAFSPSLACGAESFLEDGGDRPDNFGLMQELDNCCPQRKLMGSADFETSSFQSQQSEYSMTSGTRDGMGAQHSGRSSSGCAPVALGFHPAPYSERWQSDENNPMNSSVASSGSRKTYESSGTYRHNPYSLQ